MAEVLVKTDSVKSAEPPIKEGKLLVKNSKICCEDLREACVVFSWLILVLNSASYCEKFSGNFFSKICENKSLAFSSSFCKFSKEIL